jgi:aminoglycoside phosphotransferase (APT) family kinase protein
LKTVHVRGSQPFASKRVDWRFLLPALRGGRAASAVVRGADDITLAALEAADVAHDLSDVWPPANPAHLIALLHGATETIADAAAHLAPGGVLYCEVARPRRDALLTGTPDVVRDRLRSAGLEPAGCWAVWPDFAEAEFHVPVDSDGAVRWFVDVELPASTAHERGVRRGLQAAARAGTVHRLLFTGRFAFTATRGPSREPALLHTAEIERHAAGAHHIALATHGLDRSVALLFDDGSACPILVAKLARTPRGEVKTRDEQAALERLHAAVPAARTSVPEPLGIASANGLTIGLERYSGGRALVHMGAAPVENIERALGGALDFLAVVNRSTAQAPPEWTSAAVERWIDPVVTAFRDASATAPDEERLLDAMTAHARELIGLSLPIVLRHGDFTPWNIRFAGDRLSVIDWEGAADGPALADALHLVTHWLEIATGATTPDERLALFAAGLATGALPGRAGAFADAALDRYCAAVGADRRFAPLMLSLVRVDVASRSAARPGEGAASLDRGYVRALAGSVDTLFARPS